MQRPIALLVSALCLSAATAQRTDTLRFRSAAFGTEREVHVHLPEFHRYAAPEVRMPVIIVLDAQHPWYVGPVLNDIRYLQYTHEVPQAIVVTVPHTDRIAECAPDSIGQPTMPLLRLLTEELPPLLEPYHPGDLRVLVGHSFTSSFALYAFVQAPGAFDAVIALSPLHLVGDALPRVAARLRTHPHERVFIAVGGPEAAKDGGHHARLTAAIGATDRAGLQDRLLFQEYPAAGHTSLPIVAFPDLLSTLFVPFALRDTLCPVNGDYLLTRPPPAPDELLRRVDASCAFSGTTLPWEVAEINGLASRLHHSGHIDHTIAIYQRAVELYPRLYELHWSLGELLLERDAQAAEASLREALRLLTTEEPTMPDRREVIGEIEGLLR